MKNRDCYGVVLRRKRLTGYVVDDTKVSSLPSSLRGRNVRREAIGGAKSIKGGKRGTPLFGAGGTNSRYRKVDPKVVRFSGSKAPVSVKEGKRGTSLTTLIADKIPIDQDHRVAVPLKARYVSRCHARIPSRCREADPKGFRVNDPKAAVALRKRASEDDWLIGSGMHLLRQFERVAMNVDRKGRRLKTSCVRESKGPKAYVNNSSEKNLECLTALPLAVPRRRAHVKRKQRKSKSRRKHQYLIPESEKTPEMKGKKPGKAVRFMGKRPVKAKLWNLLKPSECQKFTLAKGPNGKRRNDDYCSGAFALAFNLNHCFQKAVRKGRGLSRKLRRINWMKRVRKSQRGELKKRKPLLRKINAKNKDDLARKHLCCRCGLSTCEGVSQPKLCTIYLNRVYHVNLGRMVDLDDLSVFPRVPVLDPYRHEYSVRPKTPPPKPVERIVKKKVKIRVLRGLGVG